MPRPWRSRHPARTEVRVLLERDRAIRKVYSGEAAAGVSRTF